MYAAMPAVTLTGTSMSLTHLTHNNSGKSTTQISSKVLPTSYLVNKSVSLQNCQQILSKPHQHLNIKHNKKTQSFMMPPKNNKANGGNTAKPKNKTNKRQTNTSLTLQTPKKNNKISLNKTTVSVNRSSKSSKGSKTRSNMNRDYLIVNETIYEC